MRFGRIRERGGVAVPEMDCARCGVSLMAEAFSGPPRVWWSSLEAMHIVAARHGWKDGVCRECQEDPDVR